MTTIYILREQRLTGQFSMALRMQKDKRRIQLIGKTTNITVDLKTVTNNGRSYNISRTSYISGLYSFRLITSNRIRETASQSSIGIRRKLKGYLHCKPILDHYTFIIHYSRNDG